MAYMVLEVRIPNLTPQGLTPLSLIFSISAVNWGWH